MDSAVEKQLMFLKEITRCSSSEDEYQKSILPVKNVLKKYLPELYPSQPDLCSKLESAYQRLKEYAAYKQLLKKNIVSLCGRTAAGKSSFFNSLYNGGILPVDTDSSSAVPVYAVCGSSQYIYGINRFDHFITMEHSDMNTIFTGFNAEEKMPLGHLFSSFLTFASAPELKHIAFLDTPGYNKLSDASVSNGEQNLIQRINFSNYILWFADINIMSMGISDNDIRILKKIDSSIPKLIIINKADAFSTKDTPEIIEKTKKLLNARGISYIDVLTYSKNHPEKYDKYKILAYLDRWDKSPSIINFSQEFERLFDSVPNNQKISELRASLMPEVQNASSSIYNIQNAFESQKAEKNDGFVSVESAQKTVNPLKNIDMSKVKITDLPIPNPEKLFRNYNDRNILDTSSYERYINAVSIILSDTMKDIVPGFSAAAKSEKYTNEISSVIASFFNVTDTASEKDSSGSDEQETDTKTDERGLSRRSKTSSRSRRRDTEPADEATGTSTSETAPSRRERSSSASSRRRLR